jgi:WD40 repeat protein
MNSNSNFLGAIADHVGQPTYLDRTYGQPLFHSESDIIALQFDSEGTIWSIEESGLLRNWNLRGQQISRTYLSDLETVWRFSADARTLVSGSDEICLWDVASGQILNKAETGVWMTALAFSPDGRQIASGHDDGSVRLWDAADLKLLKTIDAHPSAISALAFRNDGLELATAGEDCKICVWNTQTFERICTMTGHPDRIPALAWQNQTNRLYSAGWDRSVRIWAVPQEDPLLLLNTHSEQVYCVAFSPDGRLLACADSDCEIHIWNDPDAKHPQHVLRGHTADVQAMAFSADGVYFASAGADRTIRVWNMNDGHLHAGPDGAKRHVIAMLPAPRRQNLFSSVGSSLQAWETESAQIAWFPTTKENVFSLAASLDGRWIATSGESAEVELWNTETHQLVRTLTHTRGPISSLSFSPDSTHLACASLSDGLVWLWDLNAAEAVLVIPEAADACTLETVVFHPKGEWIAVGGIDFLSTGGSDGAVCIWDLQNRDKLKTFERGVTSLCFDPKCRYLAGGTVGYSVIVWDLEEDKVVFDLPGHTERIGAIAFSPDGSWLISASDDCTLRVWNVLNGRLVVARQFDTAIQSLSFSSDGNYLFTGNADATCYRLALRLLIDE